MLKKTIFSYNLEDEGEDVNTVDPDTGLIINTQVVHDEDVKKEDVIDPNEFVGFKGDYMAEYKADQEAKAKEEADKVAEEAKAKEAEEKKKEKIEEEPLPEGIITERVEFKPEPAPASVLPKKKTYGLPEEMKKPLPDDFIDEIAVIGAKTVIRGNIFTDGHIRVDGIVEGSIACKGDATLNGEVMGDISCRNLTVNHTVLESDVAAASNITLKNNSAITGNISAQTLTVEKGSKIKGEVEIG